MVMTIEPSTMIHYMSKGSTPHTWEPSAKTSQTSQQHSLTPSRWWRAAVLSKAIFLPNFYLLFVLP